MKNVNDTGFRLVFGSRDWTQRMTAALPVDDGAVVWNAACGAVRLRARVVRFPRVGDVELWAPSDRRGAARDRYGSWYAVTDDRFGIRVRPAGARDEERFWPVDDPAECPGDAADAPGTFQPATPPSAPSPTSLRGLTITTRHYLVMGTEQPAGLLVFDLHGGGPPQVLTWPPEVLFHPVDLAARPGGGLWILDRAPEESYPPRLWTLDRAFRVVAPSGTAGLSDGARGPGIPAPLFHSKHSSAPDDRFSGWMKTRLTADLAFDLGAGTGSGTPMAIESLPDDTVLVLRVDASTAEPASTVARYAPLDPTDPERGQASLSDPLGDAFEADAPSTWRAHDLAVRVDRAEPPPVRATLYAVGADGTQALVYDLKARSDDLRLALRAQYVPLRQFGGRGLTAAGDTVYYDSADRWLALAVQPRSRHVATGQIVTRRPFDGDVPGCVWHRVFLDACIPSGSSVRIESRTADEERLLASEPWQPEPSPYLRAAGSERPYDDHPFSADETDLSGAGTWEMLLQRAEGRYLDLRLTLRGNGRTTPRLRALRVYAPRFSYLTAYLPDVYQSASPSADFLERFLANPEGLFTALEGRIAEVQQLFDTRTVPAEYLNWLGGWLGATFDADLSPARRRLFLDHAMTLYRQRGTVGGLLLLLRLLMPPCPAAALGEGCSGETRHAGYDVRIVEAFRTRSVSRVRLGDLSESLRPHLTPRGAAWTPAQGATALHERFRAFLAARYDDPAARASVWPDARLPPLLPAADTPESDARRDDWRTFIQRELSLPYAEMAPGDTRALARYRTFLRRRYAGAALPAPYDAARPDDVAFPDVFPESGPRLVDWIQFVSFDLPVERTAHRFTVLVPALPNEAPDIQTQRLDLVRRIVARERPAHTAFDVRPYWALFRVGVVRVTYDTVLGESSRYATLVLGDTDLATGALASAHPFDVAARRVAGRDATSSPIPL